MTLEYLNHVAAQLPEYGCLIAASRQQMFAVRSNRQRGNRACMAFERLNFQPLVSAFLAVESPLHVNTYLESGEHAS